MTPPAVDNGPITRPQGLILYAGFWRRFGAYVLDSLILGAISWAIIVVFLMGALGISKSGMPDEGASMMAGTGFVLYCLFVMVGGWLYYALMESSKNGGTLGKMAFGLRVTDTQGYRISFARATGRYFGKFVSSLILGIGYLMAGWTSKKQGLHDIMAETLVLRKGKVVPAAVAHNAFPETMTSA